MNSLHPRGCAAGSAVLGRHVLVEVLADEAGDVAGPVQAHVDAPAQVPVVAEGRATRPAAPTGLGRFAVLVSTRCWCGYWPVKRLARDTQQSESTTKEWRNDAPVAGHPVGVPHGLQEIHREVVHQHQHDVRGPQRRGFEHQLLLASRPAPVQPLVESNSAATTPTRRDPSMRHLAFSPLHGALGRRELHLPRDRGATRATVLTPYASDQQVAHQSVQQGEAVLGEDRLGVELDAAVVRPGEQVHVPGRGVGLDA